MKYFLTACLSLFLVACGSNPPKISDTKTGYPEIVISRPAKLIKPHLVSDALDRGYTLKADTDYMLEFTRPPRTAGESLGASLIVGNSYSNNTIELQYTLVETQGKTRVVGKLWTQAVMPFGKVNRQPNNNGSSFNAIQGFFNDLKNKLQ